MAPVEAVEQRAGLTPDWSFLGVSSLLFAASAGSLIYWTMSMYGGGSMSMVWTKMPGQTWLSAAATFMGMWMMMMLAMMLPSLTPSLLSYRRAVRRQDRSRLGGLTALAGAQIIFYPTAIGWHRSEVADVRHRQHAAWETVQRGHAIANGVFVAAVNRVGVEDGLEFWGSTFVADPFGEVIARASSAAEEILVVECDLNKIEQTRRNWPFLRDRRIDAYGDLLRRFRS